MDKHIVAIEKEHSLIPAERWLDLEQLVQVRLSSEDRQFPIESALLSRDGSGWRAALPGAQTISLHFHVPQPIHRIHLVFCEEEAERSQEFVLRWTPAGSDLWFELVRQQYVFSPPGTCREVEDYSVNLEQVLTLELSIVPDIVGNPAFSSLRTLSLA